MITVSLCFLIPYWVGYRLYPPKILLLFGVYPGFPTRSQWFTLPPPSHLRPSVSFVGRVTGPLFYLVLCGPLDTQLSDTRPFPYHSLRRPLHSSQDQSFVENSVRVSHGFDVRTPLSKISPSLCYPKHKIHLVRKTDYFTILSSFY